MGLFLPMVFLAWTCGQTLAQSPPSITKQPQSLSLSLGDRAVISVVVTGDSPFSFQWTQGNSSLDGATNRSIILTNVSTSHAGSYRVVVTNPLGSVTSDPALLEVDTAFTKVTGTPITSFSSNGSAWVDYDVDGRLDLFTSSGYGCRLFHGEGAGVFKEVKTGNPLVQFPATGVQIATGIWGDYDNDGLPDVFLPMGGEWATGRRKNVLFRNLGGGGFIQIKNNPIVDTMGQATTAAWGDYDHDGWLDLFAPSVQANGQTTGGRDLLFHNERNGMFTSITNDFWLPDGEQNFDAAWGDLDGDGDLDLVTTVARPRVLENQGDGTFEPFFPLAVGGARARGMTLGDYDNDGDLDVFQCRDLAANQLFRNDGGLVFEEVGESAGMTRTDGHGSYGAAWADYDNDGWLDLFVGNYTDGTGADDKGNNSLFHNNGDGTFTPVTSGSLVNGRTQGIGAAWGDYDEDGFLDVLITYYDGSPGAPALFHNNGNGNGWLVLKLEGTKSNRSAYGAKVRLTATIGGRRRTQLREIGAGSAFQCQNDIRAHFGLGDAAEAEEIAIEWPSGVRQVLRNVAGRQHLNIVESDERLRLHWTAQAGNQPGYSVTVSGSPKDRFVLEGSTDLRDWMPLTKANFSSLPETVQPTGQLGLDGEMQVTVFGQQAASIEAARLFIRARQP